MATARLIRLLIYRSLVMQDLNQIKKSLNIAALPAYKGGGEKCDGMWHGAHAQRFECKCPRFGLWVCSGDLCHQQGSDMNTGADIYTILSHCVCLFVCWWSLWGRLFDMCKEDEVNWIALHLSVSSVIFRECSISLIHPPNCSVKKIKLNYERVNSCN